MADIRWTPAAADDLETILLAIGRERRNPAAAERFAREFVAKAEIYAAEPLLAAQRPDLGKDARSFQVFRYVAIYRPTAQGIEILRIIHGARDVLRVFRKRAT